MDKLFRWSLIAFALYPALINQTAKGVLAALVLLVQLWVLLGTTTHKRPQSKWFWILLTAPVVGYVVSLGYTENTSLGLKYLERTIFWAVFPWLFYLNRAHFSAGVWRSVENSFMLSMAGLTTFGLGKMVVSGFLWRALATQDSYFWIRTKLEWVTALHPTYFAMMATLALWMALARLKSQDMSHGSKWPLVGAIGLLTLGIALAASKIILPVAALGVIIILPNTHNLKTWLRFAAWGAAALLVVVLSLKPTRERAFTLIQALQSNQVDQNNPDSMRKGIWACSWELVLQQPWWGVGLGDFQTELNACYRLRGYDLAEERQFNTHNQYLQIWVAAGLVPMLAFGTALFLQVVLAWFNKNRLHLAFALLVASVCMTENILERQDGIFFMVFFTTLLVHFNWLTSQGKHYINGKFMAQKPTGVQRYAAAITTHLPNNQFVVVNPPAWMVGAHPSALRPLLLLLWEQFWLPFQLSTRGTPLLLNLGNTAPWSYPHNWIVIHDVAPLAHPEWFSKRFARWYRWMLQWHVKHCQKLMAISPFTAQEISNNLKLNGKSIGLAPNGVPHLGSEVIPAPFSFPYILAVGTLSDRKNQHRLLAAFLAWNPDNMHLVLAGNSAPDLAWSHGDLLAEALATGKVHWVQNPSDAQLLGLYSGATACAYLSLYEGFGLPIAEALTQRIPTVMADIPAFASYFQGHGMMVDPLDEHAIQMALIQVTQEASLWKARAAGFNPMALGLDYAKTANLLAEWANDATVLTSRSEAP